MVLRVTGMLVAAVLLGGCGSESGSPRGPGGVAPTAGPGATVTDGPLAGLHGDELCGMVDFALLDKQFGEPFAEALGGVNPPEQDRSVVCSYTSKAFMDAEIDDLADKLQVKTSVTRVTEESTAREALDAAMVDVGEKVAYQPVDGLGEVAGFAGGELIGSGGSLLVAIIEIDGELVEVAVDVQPDGTVEQLRPIAEELLPQVVSER